MKKFKSIVQYISLIFISSLCSFTCGPIDEDVFDDVNSINCNTELLDCINGSVWKSLDAWHDYYRVYHNNGSVLFTDYNENSNKDCFDQIQSDDIGEYTILEQTKNSITIREDSEHSEDVYAVHTMIMAGTEINITTEWFEKDTFLYDYSGKYRLTNVNINDLSVCD